MLCVSIHSLRRDANSHEPERGPESLHQELVVLREEVLLCLKMKEN